MKAILLTLAVTGVAAVLAPTATAATKSVELGLSYGSLGGNKTKGDPGTDLNFSVQTVGLFLFDQFAIGPAFQYFRMLDLGNKSSSYSSWDLAIGPKAKFYFTDLKGSLAPYVDAQLMTGQGGSKGFGSSEDTTNSVSAGGGVVIFLGANAALDLELTHKVSFKKTEYDEEVDSSGFATTAEDDTDRDADTGLQVWLSVFL